MSRSKCLRARFQTETSGLQDSPTKPGLSASDMQAVCLPLAIFVAWTTGFSDPTMQESKLQHQKCDGHTTEVLVAQSSTRNLTTWALKIGTNL